MALAEQEDTSIQGRTSELIDSSTYIKPDYNPKDVSFVNTKFNEVMSYSKEVVSQQITDYNRLLQENNAFRYAALTFLEDITKRKVMREGEGVKFNLTPEELYKLSKGTSKMLNLRKQLYRFVHLYSVIDSFNF